MEKFKSTLIPPGNAHETAHETIDEGVLEKKRARKVLILRFLVIIVILGSWELLGKIGVINTYFFSCPSKVFATAVTYFSEKTLLIDVGVTASETLVGFLSGTIIGAIIGLSFWWSRTYSDVSQPYMVILNAMPKLALAPLIIALFHTGFFSKVVISFLMTVITCAISVFAGVKAIDKSTETLLYSLGASRFQVFFKVVIPSTIPSIMNCLRLNISLALSGAFVGEFIASRRGLGHIVSYASTLMDNNLIWVGIFIMAIIAMIFYGLVTIFENFMVKHVAVLNPK